MSVDLADIKRLKFTRETLIWLKGEIDRHPGRTPQEILRDTLHGIAVAELDHAKLLMALATAEGLTGNFGDGRGQGGKR